MSSVSRAQWVGLERYSSSPILSRHGLSGRHVGSYRPMIINLSYGGTQPEVPVRRIGILSGGNWSLIAIQLIAMGLFFGMRKHVAGYESPVGRFPSHTGQCATFPVSPRVVRPSSWFIPSGDNDLTMIGCHII